MAFLAASAAQRDEEARALEAQQRRELEQAQALVAEQAKAARRLRVGFLSNCSTAPLDILIHCVRA